MNPPRAWDQSEVPLGSSWTEIFPGVFGQAAAVKGRFVPAPRPRVRPRGLRSRCTRPQRRLCRGQVPGAGGTSPALAQRQRFDGHRGAG